jgi:hypothetical protein
LATYTNLAAPAPLTALTVTVAVPLTPFSVAVIVTVPELMPVASPCVPLVLLTVATAVFDEDHVTCVVTSWVELSLYVAVA